MSNNTVAFGETDFDSEDDFVDSGKKTEFLKLKDGTNSMRVITKPVRFVIHRVMFNDDPRGEKKGGWNVRCMGTNCDFCAAAKAEKPLKWNSDLLVNAGKPRWYIGVIDRDESPNDAKTFEFGALIRGKLRSLSNNKKWGSPLGYDIDVTKNSEAKKAMEFYDVVGDPTSIGPLGPEDEVLASEFDADQLAKRCQPLSEEQAKEAVKKYRTWLDSYLESKNKSKGQSEKKNTKPATAPVQKHEEPEEDDEAPAEGDYSFESTRES